MLSDHERRTLREIQRHLIVEDPDFERTFRTFEVPTPPTRHRWVHTTLVLITAMLVPVMLLAGSSGGAVAFAVITCTLWWTRHLEYRTSHHETGE